MSGALGLSFGALGAHFWGLGRRFLNLGMKNVIFTKTYKNSIIFDDVSGRRGSKCHHVRSRRRLFRRLDTTSVFTSILEAKSEEHDVIWSSFWCILAHLELILLHFCSFGALAQG